MEKEQQAGGSWDSLTGTWVKSITDFWSQSMTGGMWPKGVFENASFNTTSGGVPNENIEKWWWETLKQAQAVYVPLFMNTWGGKGGMAEKMNPSPEALFGFAQMGLEGYLDIQKKWFEGMMKGKTAQSGMAEELNRIPSVWIELFQKILEPLLNIPAVGLTRGYQEKLNHTVEKFTTMSADVGELVQQLYMPIDKASKIMREHLEKMAKEGNLSQDSKESYNAWIGTLERCYMDLLRSPEYIQLLHRTVGGFCDYSVAKEEVVSDSLKFFPFPSNKDFDELAREIYTMNKKLKELAKRLEMQEKLIDRQGISGTEDTVTN